VHTRGDDDRVADLGGVGVKLSVRYASHLLVLLQAVAKTYESVLELGMGVFSSPILHNVCTLEKRELVSIDNNETFVKWNSRYANTYHKIFYVDDWAKADIDRKWDVAFVDHSPSERRIVEIERLANLARYIVVHDTNYHYNSFYHYDKVLPLFKYSYTFEAVEPSTTVFSNFVNLDGFWDKTWARNVSFGEPT
jgi:hypothetical protein